MPTVRVRRSSRNSRRSTRRARSADPALLQEEVGDLLMAVTSLARHLQVDPETALRQANRKFEARFARMETLAPVTGASSSAN